MTDVSFRDMNPLDAYDRFDPLHIRLELLKRIVDYVETGEDPKSTSSALILIANIHHELEEATDLIDEFKERIS